MRGSGRRRQASVENGDLYVSGLQPLEDQVLLGQEETPSFASLCGLGGEVGGLTRKGLGSSDDNSAIKRSPGQTCSVAPGQFQIGDLHTCSLLGSSIVLKLESSQLNISSSCIPSVAISVRLTLLIHNFVISPLISFNLASLP